MVYLRNNKFLYFFPQQVADLINCDPSEVIFTSGATESNNTAIKGVAHFYGVRKKHIITTQTVCMFFSMSCCSW
jgi:cysteine sulfinate desulfinase/cysteine desulfurase-like protein